MNEAEAGEIGAGDQGSSQKFLKSKTQKKKKPQYYYALQFNVTFTHNNDSVYFAYSLPYTLTEMTELILNKEQQIQVVETQEEEVKSQNEDAESSKDSEENKQSIPVPNIGSNPSQIQGTQGGTPSWQENGCTFEVPSKCIFYKREIMARSICGLPLYQITISRDSKTYKRKPVVIVTSRVHAAETPASYVFDGIYNFLCSNNPEAKFLRKFYTFILVPTLNPDGVVCGNYRSSISGVDLNRQWIAPDEEFQPEIYSIKQLMKTIGEKERRQLWIYCDLHGHSKKKNTFFYGCNTAANGGFLSWTIVRLLPRIFAKKTHLFNYRDCRFKVEPYKLGTGRVVAWKQFMITHSFTLEASFYGYDFGEDEHRLFTPKDYGDVGQKFCQSIYELHFLWKSIRNELKLTNGWLKPRKLIEITGVPAAQILSEELQKKKKEDQKRKAIEHYEQFLKKFYNKSDGHGPSSSSQNNANGTNNRRASKLLSAQNNNPQALFMPQSSQKPRVVTVQPGLGVQSKQATAEKSRNRDLNSGNTQERSNHNAALSGARGNLIPVSSSQDEFSLQNEEERIYNLLQGLVKIQALIRGFLVRKKFKIKIPQIRIGLAKNKVFVKTQKPRDIEEDFDVQLQNSGNPLRSSDLQSLGKASLHDKLMLGGIAYGEAGDKSSQIKQKEDWRLYFQDNELDTAYNHVEVEREDDPEDALSAGSSSNPSNDNFDLQEMYEQIYQLPNAKEQAKRKKEAKRRFMQEINDQDYIDQQSMFQILDGAFKGKRGQLVHKSINQLKSKVKRGKPDLKTNQATSAQVSPEKMIIRRPSLDQRDLNLIKKSDNASPMQQHNNFEDNEAYPLTAHQIIDPNKSSHQRLHTGNQQRHLYQYGPNHFQNHQNITNAQLKMFNQNVIIGPSNAGYGGNAGFGPHYGKKESIQQVIKDCFITKKIGNPSSTQNNFFGAQHSEGSRVHSVNQKSQQANHYQQTTSGNSGSGQKRNHNNNNGSSNHQSKSASKATNHGQQFKTPAQRLQEQRDQIKQYFNHNQPGQQLSVGSGYEKYRALMRENAIPMQQQFISYGENNMNYPSPLTMISSKIEGNAVPLTQGLIINQALSNTNSNTHEHPTSSLFMKYVKSKLVRKIRTDQIPQQITDKYIDLYKELIDKEAQKKAEEQDFLRKHIQNSTSTNPNSFTATSQIATQQSQLTRNKIQTRSEQKSRSKHLARGAGGAGTYQNHTSRKQQQQPVNLQSSFVTYGMMQNQPQQQHSIMNAKYDEPIGANINSLNMTFNEHKQQLNEVIMVRQSSELHRQLQSGINNNNYNRNQDTNNEYDVKASSNSDIIDPSMKLPLIGNFAHTVDYKKKSRDTLIDNPTSNSGVFARQQAAAFSINQNSNEEQITMKTPLTNSNIQQQTQQTVMLPLGGNYPLEASNQNISMYSINNAAQKDLIVPVDIKSPQPKVILQAQGTGRRHIMAPATSGNGGGYSNMNKRGGAGVVSDNSIDSSIDEEMLDKIKNIYSEMRKHTGGPAPGNNSSLYYGGTSNHSGYPQSNLYYPGIVNNSFSRSMMNGPSKGGSYQAPSNNRGHKARIHGNQSSQIVSHHTVDDNGTSGINQSQSNYFNMHHNAGSGVQGPQRQHGNFINAGMPVNQGI